MVGEYPQDIEIIRRVENGEIFYFPQLEDKGRQKTLAEGESALFFISGEGVTSHYERLCEMCCDASSCGDENPAKPEAELVAKIRGLMGPKAEIKTNEFD